jgi:hypothetical protein
MTEKTWEILRPGTEVKARDLLNHDFGRLMSGEVWGKEVPRDIQQAAKAGAGFVNDRENWKETSPRFDRSYNEPYERPEPQHYPTLPQLDHAKEPELDFAARHQGDLGTAVLADFYVEHALAHSDGAWKAVDYLNTKAGLDEARAGRDGDSNTTMMGDSDAIMLRVAYKGVERAVRDYNTHSRDIPGERGPWANFWKKKVVDSLRTFREALRMADEPSDAAGRKAVLQRVENWQKATDNYRRPEGEAVLSRIPVSPDRAAFDPRAALTGHPAPVDRASGASLTAAVPTTGTPKAAARSLK